MDSKYYIILGQRIRDRRKKLGITQSELCDGHITRNMLSQIETGNAHPSIDTLLFLAEKLGISASYLVCSDEKEEAQYLKIESVIEIRRLFSAKQYDKCAQLCRNVSVNDEEIATVLALCETYAALTCFKRSELSSCEKHIDEAENVCPHSSYFYDNIMAASSFIRLLIHSVTTSTIPKSAQVSETQSVFNDYHTYLYLLAVAMYEEGHLFVAASFAPLMTDAVYKKYLNAKELMARKQYNAALLLLREIAVSGTDCFTEYFSLRDLEICCQKCDSYKEAYECAKKRMSLPDKYAR